MPPPAPCRRLAAAILLVVVAGLAAAPAARADRKSAEAALPQDGLNPFFTVTTTTTTSGDWDDLPRLPEYCVYPNGTFLVQKSDERLWMGHLTRDQVLDFLQFLLDDARLPGIDMTYILSSPVTTFRRYTLSTRTGTWSVRRRASGGFGTGVREGERALSRIDRRLFQLAEQADQPYAAAALFVVSRPVGDDPALPVWSWNDRVPFAALAAATDLASRHGTVLAGPEAQTVSAAVQQGPAWRFGGLAVQFRARPALPHEAAQPPWRSPTALPAPGTAPGAVGAPPAPPPPAPLPVAPTAPNAGPPAPGTPAEQPSVRLLLVGADSVDVGAGADAGQAPPDLHVARNAAEWKALFDETLRAQGDAGRACATALQPIRDAVAAHDFTTGPLVLLLSPPATGYAFEVAPRAEVLPDGTARVVVTWKHEPPAPSDAGTRVVRWTLHRAEGPLPETVRLRANGKDV